MVAWLTASQVIQLLKTNRPTEYWLDTNEKFYFGDAKNINTTYDGTYYKIGTTGAYCWINISASGSSLYAGDEAADDLFLAANKAYAYPYILLNGSSTIDLKTPTGEGIKFYETSTLWATFDRTATTLTTDATTATAFTFIGNSVTTATLMWFQAVGLTSGSCIVGQVDSDLCTTGFIFKGLSGANTLIPVFTVDAFGSIKAYTETGTARYKRTHCFSASEIANVGSGATIAALNGIVSFNLDAVTEYIYCGAHVHADWNASTDVTIAVTGYLTNAETANDLIRMSVRCDYFAPNESANTAKTQTLTQDYDIGASAAQYLTHTLSFTLDHDLADNVLQVGDKLNLKVWLDDVSTAPAVIAFNVTNVEISYLTPKPQTEA